MKGFQELFFFTREFLEDAFAVFRKLRVSALAILNHNFGRFGEEYPFDAELFAMANRAADEAPEHIACANIGRHDCFGISEDKGSGAHMVRNDPEALIHFRIIL